MNLIDIDNRVQQLKDIEAMLTEMSEGRNEINRQIDLQIRNLIQDMRFLCKDLYWAIKEYQDTTSNERNV